MSGSSRVVRFGLALIVMLIFTGLIYAGTETPESELTVIVEQLTKVATG